MNKTWILFGSILTYLYLCTIHYINMEQIFRKWALLLTLVLAPLVASAQDNAKYHIVEEGQTLYSIARLYNISPNELMKLNPNAGDLIRPGDKLRIPDQAQAQTMATGPGAQFIGSTSTTANSTAKDKCKEMYQIKKKDNLYRIALEYNLTIEEIVNANPGMTIDSKLKKGEWICIPYSKAELQAEADRLAAERARAEANAKKTSKSHLNMAVVLPLKEQSDRGGKMVEFYQGLLMAVDSVRKQGISVDVYAYHSGNSVAEINSILEHQEMKNMDVVFGPLDGVQANILNQFCLQNKVRLVMPFATTSSYASNNPHAYVATPQTEVVNREGAVAMCKRFKGYNVVFLNVNAGDNRGKSYVNLMSQQLGTQDNSSKTLDVEADDATYASTFSLTRNNLVVLNNSSQNALKRSIRSLKAFMLSHPDYKISLMGYPEWSTFQGSILQDFYALDTYVFTPFYRNISDAKVQNFESRFKTNFGHELIKTAPRYGMLGMDLGYYFLNGLAKLGDYFDERYQTLTFTPLQNKFQFTADEAGKPHINTAIQIVHYHPIGRIEVLNQK